ncbi:hypothetical protein NP233_g10624 [Leucocoprinus birnbaumii]|uniref:CxC2-like cysteine cluster KDZ transposase-associated domain-containing protein n=1 Tax=Leucocoprinus birnbaumii TaxID=56174 RepID=A0AAD5VLM2_9AGAR|nr:hypothetical protein NP233_g10624 [Leucocoprinus birnbaumii]
MAKNARKRAGKISVVDEQPQVHNIAVSPQSQKRKRHIDEPQEAGNTSPKRAQSASAKMAVFQPELLQAIQDTIFKLESSAHIVEDATCSGCRGTCTDCSNAHDSPACRRSVFRVQKWLGSHFEKHALYDLGFCINLGHSGQPCHLNKNPPIDFVIVHTNGIHKCRVLYCLCQNQKPNWKALQLVEHRLFPATSDTPQTAFTFAVLDEFHCHSLSSKSSAYDYFNALKRLVDATFPHLVPDRYREFMLVMCFWRHLALLRHGGQEHNIDAILTHRRQGSLVVWCPACPEIGFNVDEKTLELATDSDMHIFTLIVSLDGNFRLQSKKKKGDPNDTALCGGNAYFVEDTAYLEYLKRIGKADEASCTSILKAVCQQDRAKFKDTEVSGVVAAQCRHQIYLPQGMVDLTKGEAYARTDYALVLGLGLEGLRQRWILVTYDVWCQYHINLKSRFANFPGWVEKSKTNAVRGAIPKMHIHGHNRSCQLKHSLVYQKYSGMTYGEGIESAWSEQNHAAASTKEQNRGHRHDTLDDFNGFWNWTKLIQLSSTLLKQYRKYSKQLVICQDDLQKMAALVSPELLSDWEALYTNGRNEDIFETKDTAPTQRKIYEALIEREQSEYGEAGFLRRGLELEEQLLLMKYGDLSESDEDRILEELYHNLCRWRSQQAGLYPQLHPLPPIDEDNIIDTDLRLPSSLSREQRTSLKLTGAADMEKDLRLGLAYDLLHQLKLEINEWNSLAFSLTKQSTKSTKRIEERVRADPRLDRIKVRQHRVMNRYNDNREILLSLDYDLGTTGLKKLTADQLWGKHALQPRELGNSSHRDPWFWGVGKPGEVTPESWNAEGSPANMALKRPLLTFYFAYQDQRVRWSRKKALGERLREEVDILKEEFRRTEVSFSKMAEVWTELACRNAGKPGYAEYAHRHAAMYTRLASDCKEKWRSCEGGLLIKQFCNG